VRTAFGLGTPPLAAPSSALPHASATIDVRNATGRTGLATVVAQALAPYGFATGDLSTIAAQSSSRVTYGTGAKTDADAAQSLLGGLPVSPDPHLAPGRIRITLGTGFTLPPTLGPHRADAPPGGTTSSAPASNPPALATAPAGTGPQGAPVDGSGIPCVD
jgi:hypothetical protein